MSLNMISTQLMITDDIRRKSFDYRVCDHLSQVLLQFLQIEDKFRFESVSKQFQRTVFQRHEELCLNNTILTRIRSNEEDSVTRFETLLQKLPNIKSIRNEFIECYPQKPFNSQID